MIVENEILVSLAVMKKLQFIGVGFLTTQNAMTKMSIVNMAQKISQIFFYSVAKIVWKKTTTQRKTKIRFNILSLAISCFH